MMINVVKIAKTLATTFVSVAGFAIRRRMGAIAISFCMLWISSSIVCSGETTESSMEKTPDNARRNFVLTNEVRLVGYEKLDSAMMNAVYLGNYQQVENLVKNGYDFKAKKTYNYSTIYQAMLNNDMKLFNLIFSAGADANATDQRKNPLIMTAINSGNMDVMKFLINHGADVNAEDDSGETVLKRAVKRKNPEIVKLLISNGAKVNAINKRDGEPILMAAMRHEDDEIFGLLVDAGADIEMDDDGVTMLMRAVNYSAIYAIKHLLANGIDVNEKNLQGSTALMWVAGGDIFGGSSRTNDTEMAKLLIEAGADANKKEYYFGNTALMYFAVGASPEAVKILIDAGADINAKNFEGETALLRSARLGKIETMKLLLDAGAEVNTKDRRGRTALNIVESGSYLKHLKEVYEETPKTRIGFIEERKRVIAEVTEAQPEIVKLLVDAGAYGSVKIKVNNQDQSAK